LLLDPHADVLDQRIMQKPTRLCPTSELVAAFDGKATLCNFYLELQTVADFGILR